MPEVAILRVHVLPADPAKRPGQRDTVVAYQVDGDPLRTRLLTIPGEIANLEQIKAAIKADAAKIASIEGQKFTL